MTREEVAEWLEFMQEEEHNNADSIVPCTSEIALGIAIEALKQPQIVRCKDCRYSLPSSENVILCTAPCESQYPKAYKPIDWFCAGGEQKEGEK